MFYVSVQNLQKWKRNVWEIFNVKFWNVPNVKRIWLFITEGTWIFKKLLSLIFWNSINLKIQHILKKMNSNSSLGPEWSKFTNQNRANIGFSESAPWIWCLDEDKLRHLSFKQMWPMYFFFYVVTTFFNLLRDFFFISFSSTYPKSFLPK